MTGNLCLPNFREKQTSFSGRGQKQTFPAQEIIITIFLLHFNRLYGIKGVSLCANAKNGKIVSFRSSERGGHRLKAALERVAWFARERPARAGRFLRRYRRSSACFQHECGWYRGRFAFRPWFWGGRAFLLPKGGLYGTEAGYLPPLRRHGNCDRKTARRGLRIRKIRNYRAIWDKAISRHLPKLWHCHPLLCRRPRNT